MINRELWIETHLKISNISYTRYYCLHF